MTNLIMPELKYFPYKDGFLAYREEGVGPVLFFLHGMNGNSRSWASSFLSLRNNFRIIAWDAPSFGSSGSFGDSIEVYQSAAKALISGLGVEDVILVGHSMGGLVATKLASDTGMSIAGLVLSSSHLGFGQPKGEPLMFRYNTNDSVAGVFGEIHQVHFNNIPVHKKYTLSIKADVADSIKSKTYIATTDMKGNYWHIGGVWENGFIKTYGSWENGKRINWVEEENHPY